MTAAAAPPRVLLADDCPERAAAICDALREGWTAEVTPVTSVEAGQNAIQEAIAAGKPLDVVMVAYAFAGTDHRPLFSKWCIRSDTLGVLIHPRPIEVDRTRVEFPLSAMVAIPRDVNQSDPGLTTQLGAFLGRPFRSAPRVENESDLPIGLKVQVQELDPDLDLGKGLEILRRLVGLLTPPQVQSFSLYSLTQGGSGAKVFRITHADTSGNPPLELVLKLTPQRHGWKALNELQRHQEIRRGLQRSVIPMIPEVRGIPGDLTSPPQPAAYCGWLAVLYHYLGTGPLILADLEQAFLHPKRCLRHLRESLAPLSIRPAWKGFSRCFLSLLFQRLEPWYQDNCQIDERRLWDVQDAPQEGLLTFPPYHFRPWEKTRIIHSLYQLKPQGKPLLGDRWQQGFDEVLNCLSTPPRFRGNGNRMVMDQRVLLTPVHGDLNASNVLVGLNHWAPFLIDFACYQPQGHVVQDVARLETAIKFELMGREARSALDGLDLDSRKLPRWCAGEEWLAAWPSDNDDLGVAIPRDSFVRRAYALCLYIRKQSREIHDRLAKVAPPSDPLPDFELSYTAALLYHTLRAIRYDSLSPLKRILAVYSVGKIMERLAGSQPPG